jgi:hypothetical protein
MNSTQKRARKGTEPRLHRWFAAGLLLSAACSDDSKTPSAEAASAMDGGASGEGSPDGGAADHEHSPTAQEGGHDSAGDGHDSAGDGGHTNRHPCGQAYAKDPRDDTMTGELVHVVVGDNGTPSDASDDPYDVLLPKEMLDWLKEQNWIQEHGDWHNVRRWDMSCQRTADGGVCPGSEAMLARGLSRAPIQEGEPGDGYAFLIMHRHMIRAFQQAFPKHVEQIRGFYRMPKSKSDAENPIPWVDVRWSDDQLETIEWLENIAPHLDVFTSEDDYAKWVQFGDNFPGFNGEFPPGLFPGDGGFPPFPGGGFPGGGFPGFPPTGLLDGGLPGFPGGGVIADGGVTADGGTSNRPGGGIHGALHGQWTIPNSPYGLADNNKNVQNFAFWRLHVWIDEMWERYRRLRGLGEDDPDYQQALLEQCEEMHTLGEALPPDADAGIAGLGGGPPAAVETGTFATQVAPILTSYCGGSVCHAAESPTLGLALAGAAPSTIRTGLVGEQASEAPLALVEPGKPELSWLYLKLTDNFAGVDCKTSRCTAMPPAGAGPSAQDIERIRSWIAAGAGAD